MTEAEWFASDDAGLMLEFLWDKTSDRKLCLLTVACCRRIWRLLPITSRAAVEALERYADGVGAAEYYTAWARADAEALAADRDPPDATTYATASACISNPPTVPSVSSSLDTAANAQACAVADDTPESEYDKTYAVERWRELAEQRRLVRDIFGNPFRSVVLDAEWLTSTVVALAAGIYAERAFDRMPILADTLQDAGCTNEDVLNHCRDTSLTHVRGCWVVDLVLGKQ